MEINIRKANIEDLKTIQDLNYMLFKLEDENWDDSLNVDWPYEKAGKDYFKDTIENDIMLVAEADNKIVGYLAGYICNSSFNRIKLAELDNMLVLEEYRKYGIGTLLINEFKSIVKEHEVESIKVTASYKNRKAIEFYIKNEFVEWDLTLRCNID